MGGKCDKVINVVISVLNVVTIYILTASYYCCYHYLCNTTTTITAARHTVVSKQTVEGWQTERYEEVDSGVCVCVCVCVGVCVCVYVWSRGEIKHFCQTVNLNPQQAFTTDGIIIKTQSDTHTHYTNTETHTLSHTSPCRHPTKQNSRRTVSLPDARKHKHTPTHTHAHTHTHTLSYMCTKMYMRYYFYHRKLVAHTHILCVWMWYISSAVVHCRGENPH